MKKTFEFQMVSVIIPVFNERKTIETIVDRVQKVEVPKELIIIDDGSTDGTKEWLIERFGFLPQCEMATQKILGHQVVPGHQVRVYFHQSNQGKGAALKLGFREARGDAFIVQDADLEYNPEEFPKLLEPLLTDQADVVYGSRFLGGWRGDLTIFSYLGNKFFTKLINAATGLSLTDVWTGYKVFKKEVLDDITLKESGFEMELELTLKIARGKWQVREVPISYTPRGRAEGKKICWRDGLPSFKAWCRYRKAS